MSSYSDHAGADRASYTPSRVGRETLLEIRSPEASRPIPPRSRETPERVQAFISHHRSFFILMAVLVGQVALLSAQISRNHSVPLAKVWAVSAVSPFERSLRGLADMSGEAWAAMREMTGAERRYRDLSARLVNDETRIRAISEEAAENVRLRALLDFRAHTSYPTVAAEVIGSSPGEGSSTVLIDRGADAGFNADEAVITPDGVVGKIVAVYPHSAQVLLITDPAAGAGALLEKDRAQGVLKGAGRGLCRLDYIMNEDGVSAGDAILTSGMDRVFPKGLPLGRVVKVGDGNIYKDVVVQPAVSLNRLEEVLVVTSKPGAVEEAKIH